MLVVCLIGICMLSFMESEKEAILLLPLTCYYVYVAYTDKKKERTKFDESISLPLLAISLSGVTFFLIFLSLFSDMKTIDNISMIVALMSLIVQIILFKKTK